MHMCCSQGHLYNRLFFTDVAFITWIVLWWSGEYALRRSHSWYQLQSEAVYETETKLQRLQLRQKSTHAATSGTDPLPRPKPILSMPSSPLSQSPWSPSIVTAQKPKVALKRSESVAIGDTRTNCRALTLSMSQNELGSLPGGSSRGQLWNHSHACSYFEKETWVHCAHFAQRSAHSSTSLMPERTTMLSVIGWHSGKAAVSQMALRS
eukprot:6208888-Pleurochrysis_carterae.AAC.2